MGFTPLRHAFALALTRVDHRTNETIEVCVLLCAYREMMWYIMAKSWL
jgi:hypothetical protein